MTDSAFPEPLAGAGRPRTSAQIGGASPRLGETFADTAVGDRRWPTRLRNAAVCLGIAILAFCAGFGTATAVNSANAAAQPPIVQLEMPEGSS